MNSSRVQTLPSGPVPGLRYVDHLGVTVPDLQQAIDFFVSVFGAEELYRSTRGRDPEFLNRNFGVPADEAFTLAMLRLPPNLNLELFEWTGADGSNRQPGPNDVGAHHLCFAVEDVDAACDHLRQIAGVRILGDVKEVGADSPYVAGNRWTYVDTPWGMRLELVDRSRVVNPPRFVIPDHRSRSDHGRA